MKVGKVRWSTMSLCRAASPSPTASSKGASWPPQCSPSSSESCSMRQKKTCQTASTSVSKPMAVCSTFGAFSCARKPWIPLSLSCCLLTTAPFSLTWRKPNTHRQPLLWCNQELRPHHQPEEDWGAAPIPSMRSVESSHQQQWHQPKHSGKLHLPG